MLNRHLAWLVVMKLGHWRKDKKGQAGWDCGILNYASSFWYLHQCPNFQPAIRFFQPLEDPSRGFFHDYVNFAKVRFQL